MPTGGIGLAFLKGWQLNEREGNQEFAEQCMNHAKGAADFVVKNFVQTHDGLKLPRIVYPKCDTPIRTVWLESRSIAGSPKELAGFSIPRRQITRDTHGE